MKFTISVPSYNQGQFLPYTIDSIVEQSHRDVEIIVHDGGSTDKSVEILKRYKRYEPCITWSSERDRGQTDAINKGLNAATGEIFAYLNSDDIYFPGALETVNAYFEQNPDCEILYGDAHHIKADGSFLEAYPTQEWDYSKLFQTCYFCQPAVFWKRGLFDKYGTFDERLHYAMDYDYWLRVGAHVKPHYLKGKVLAGSRLHEDTKTLSQRVAVHHEILQVVRRHARNESDTYAWLNNLASVKVQTMNWHPSKTWWKHRIHVWLFKKYVRQYAEQYHIRIDSGLNTFLESL